MTEGESRGDVSAGPSALPNLQHWLQAGKPQFSTGLGDTKPLGGVLKSPGHLQTAAAADEITSTITTRLQAYREDGTLLPRGIRFPQNLGSVHSPGSSLCSSHLPPCLQSAAGRAQSIPSHPSQRVRSILTAFSSPRGKKGAEERAPVRLRHCSSLSTSQECCRCY